MQFRPLFATGLLRHIIEKRPTPMKANFQRVDLFLFGSPVKPGMTDFYDRSWMTDVYGRA